MKTLQDRRSEGRVCGIILRSQLIVILLKSLYVENKRFWLPETSIQTFRDVYPRYPSIKVTNLFKINTSFGFITIIILECAQAR